jgi:hypothetical protein
MVEELVAALVLTGQLGTAVSQGRDAELWRCTSDQTRVVQIDTGPGNNGSWQWDCFERVVVSCDHPSAEPRDIGYPTCLSRSTLQADGHRQVSFDDLGASGATLEWRAASAQGTELLAARPLVGEPATVMVAPDVRILRIIRPQAAPYSLHVGRYVSDEPVSIPPPEAGAELVYLSTEADSRGISALVVEDHLQTRLPGRRASYLSRAVLPAGQYDLRPIYSSGLRGQAIPSVLENSRTTEVTSLSFHATGGALVSAPDDILEHTPRSLEIHAVSNDGSASQRTLVWSGAVPQPPLAWMIDGLSPGSFAVVLKSDEQTITAESIEVGPDRTTAVELQSPRVFVDGVLSYGAVPAVDTPLHFEIERQRYRAVTDAAGRFTLALPKPGRYTARIEATKYFWGWTDDVELQAGRNRFDWKVPGGTISLSIGRADGVGLNEVVQLKCLGPKYRAAGPLTVEELGAPIIIGGVPWGEVTCTADTMSGLVSERAVARLSETNPNAEMTLNMKLRVSMLELRDARGDLLSGARVVIGNVTAPETPAGSGHYEVRRSLPGDGMSIIAPGHVPVCRILKESDFPTARFQLVAHGTTAVAFRLTPVATRPPGFLHHLPGSECPVPLLHLNPRLMRVGTSTEISFVLPPGTYQYQPFGTYPLQTFTVPGPVLELRREPR